MVFVVAVTAGVRPFFVPGGWETLLVTLLLEGSLDDCDPIAGLDGFVRGTYRPISLSRLYEIKKPIVNTMLYWMRKTRIRTLRFLGRCHH